jgi:uncharacterized protein
MWKLSRYNHFQPWEDGYFIAYSARSGAVALMTSENYTLYHKIADKLSAAAEPEFSPEEQELIKQLKYGSFVDAGDRDEWNTIRFQHNLARYDQSSLGLTLAPTMACNMACPYCYEGNKKGRMSAEIIESLLNFVEKKAKGLTQLDIAWYGGEPLLALDIIEDLTESFRDLGKEYKFEYNASMISNGYLLNKENVDKLTQLGVKQIQVTLDGPARFHNLKRPLKNGQESFDTIIKNLVYASTKIGVGIRVNVDRSFTIDVIAELLDELTKAGIRERIGLYFGQLEASTKVCSNISESCYDAADFSKVEIDFYRLLLDKGFRIDKLPQPSVTFCMAQNVNSFVIDHEGNLCRCYNYVGDPAKAMGNIRDEIDYQHPNFVSLFEFDPFMDESCSECGILPVCMGGCPSRRADRDLPKEKMCDTWKHNLQPMLEIIARSRQQQVASARKEQ